jgi:hypothetical protein
MKAIWVGLLLSISILAIPSAKAATLFFDDFNAGASASWGNESENWTATGGVYNAQTPRVFPVITHSLVSGLLLTDFSVDVNVNNGVDGGIWLRAANFGCRSVGFNTGLEQL